MAHSFTLDGTDFSGTDYAVTMMNAPHPVSEARVNIEQLAQGDGVAIQGVTSGPLVWRCECAIMANSSSTRDTRWGNVKSAFEAMHGSATVGTFVPDWEGYDGTENWNARVLRKPYNTRIGKDGVLFSVDIIAPDPAAN